MCCWLPFSPKQKKTIGTSLEIWKQRVQVAVEKSVNQPPSASAAHPLTYAPIGCAILTGYFVVNAFLYLSTSDWSCWFDGNMYWMRNWDFSWFSLEEEECHMDTRYNVQSSIVTVSYLSEGTIKSHHQLSSYALQLCSCITNYLIHCWSSYIHTLPYIYSASYVSVCCLILAGLYWITHVWVRSSPYKAYIDP